jgi:hypothetical protein
MNSVTEVEPVGSIVSRETMSKRLFKICYLTDGLVQILCYPASDHDPESNVHFDRHRHRHRASPRSFRCFEYSPSRTRVPRSCAARACLHGWHEKKPPLGLRSATALRSTRDHQKVISMMASGS